MRIGIQALLLTVMLTACIEAAEPTPGLQVEQQLETEHGTIPYLLYLPKNYEDLDKVPVMLFLHGRGESYGPLSLVAKWGPPQMIARGDEMPYIVVSPQCPRESSWSKDDQQELLVSLLDHVMKQFKADASRVYLTGLSMGGYGSWRLAADHPTRFAAAAMICGGGDPARAERLVSLPIWVFHGDQDKAVAFSKSVDMVNAIRAAGGEKVRFTTLENVGHNSWSAAYATPELYQWMNQHSSEATE